MRFVRNINMPLDTIRGTNCIGIGLAVDGLNNYIAILEVETKKVFVEEIIIPKVGQGGANTKIQYRCKKIENDDEWTQACHCFRKANVFDKPQLDKKVIDYWNQKQKKRYEPFNNWIFSRKKGTDYVPKTIRQVIEEFRREYYPSDQGN